jgi:hypothetical protein
MRTKLLNDREMAQALNRVDRLTACCDELAGSLSRVDGCNRSALQRSK